MRDLGCEGDVELPRSTGARHSRSKGSASAPPRSCAAAQRVGHTLTLLPGSGGEVPASNEGGGTAALSSEGSGGGDAATSQPAQLVLFGGQQGAHEDAPRMNDVRILRSPLGTTRSAD